MRYSSSLRLIPVTLLLGVLAGCASQPPQPLQIDRISPEQLAALVPPAQSSLSLEQIVTMSKQGKSDAEVIEAIKQSQSRYSLAPSDVLDWHQKGISKGVLDYMQHANALAEQNAIADEINKREKARVESEARLKRERDMARLRSMDPWFYGGPGFYGGPWGYRPYWGGGWRYW
ncbi:hypothetical protein [Methylophilus sp. 5]|uniref:hypothetical protein n=1 Tax=Methylophilus sp. 5 TaxID=1112274 RepID=UPI00048D932E|nr:hypothetical protein [Methylophilus sp. 5]